MTEVKTDVKAEEVSVSEEIQSKGLDPVVAVELQKMIDSNRFSLSDLDDRAFEAVKELNPAEAKQVLIQFSSCALDHVSNKSAFLCSQIKTYKQRRSLSGMDANEPSGPDADKLKELLDRTGYSMEVSTGQRKYGGPPPDWEGAQPGNGCEIFVGKLPKDCFEDELVPLMEQAGTIWDLRIMIDQQRQVSRGFGFVTFTDKDGAKQAVEKYNDYEIRPGRKLKVNVSVANVRLFVGNIPKQKTKEEIQEEFAKHTEGVTEVIIYKSSEDPTKKNRGFAFIEYDCHKNASNAKRRLKNSQVRPFQIDVIVDWADPQEEPDAETMSKVKNLYVANLSTLTTEDELKTLFEEYGKVERVKKVRDYAFIHFEERDNAVKALEALHQSTIGGNEISVTLAKPQLDSRKKDKMRWDRMRRQGYGGEMMGGFGGGGFGGGEFSGGYGNFGGGFGGGRGFGGRGRGRGAPAPMMGFDYGYMDDGYDYYDDSGYYGGGAGYGGRGGGFGAGRGGGRGMGGRGMGAGGFGRGRGNNRGRGRGGGFQGKRGGMAQKRKAEPMEQDGAKRSAGGWGVQPIAQQPLSAPGGGGHGGNQQFYDDDFGGSGW